MKGQEMAKVAKIVNESELKNKLYSNCSKCGDNQFNLDSKMKTAGSYGVATYKCCNCTSERERVYKVNK